MDAPAPPSTLGGGALNVVRYDPTALGLREMMLIARLLLKGVRRKPEVICSGSAAKLSQRAITWSDVGSTPNFDLDQARTGAACLILCPMKPATSNNKLRPRTFVVLVLWLLAWTVSAAQPCCEALVSAIPHHSSSAASEAHQHAHHHAPQPPSRDHQHCPQAKPVDLSATAPSLTAVTARSTLFTHAPPPPLDAAMLIGQRTSQSLLSYAVPPPLSRPPSCPKPLLI